MNAFIQMQKRPISPKNMGLKNMAQTLLYTLSTKTNFITLPNPPLHEAPSDESQKGLFLYNISSQKMRLEYMDNNHS